MRKFAMTLLLGLGMATASFAGGVETAEAKAEAAPKGCLYVLTSCVGFVTVCGENAFDEAQKVEDELCGKIN